MFRKLFCGTGGRHPQSSLFRKLFCGTGGRHPQSSEISAVLCLESLSVQPLGFIRKAVKLLAVLCVESFFIQKAVKFQQSCVSKASLCNLWVSSEKQ